MDLVERVARAICKTTNLAMEGVTEACYGEPDRMYMRIVKGQRELVPTPSWKLYVKQAEAAIEAVESAMNEYDDAELT